MMLMTVVAIMKKVILSLMPMNRAGDIRCSTKMETFKAEPVIADSIIGTFLSALDCGGGSGLWAWEA